MKNVIVTGCAGFIGSTLTESLLKRGYHVTGIDCLTENYSNWIKLKNMNRFIDHPKFTWIKADLNSLDLVTLLKDKQYVFHLAAIPGVRSSWGEDFQVYIKHNILATQKLLEAIRMSNIEKMIYASSSSIYGSISGPTKEEQLPAPYSPYGVSKLSGEHLCSLYNANYGIPVVSLRYFTVYGPRQRPDMAFHNFIKNMLNDQPITVYGDGNQSRDFTYITDAVDANLLSMEKGRIGQVYNIGGNSRIELKEVIRLLGEIAGKSVKISYVEEQPGDPKHTWSDISKAQSDLGYNPMYPLEKGLQEQVAFIRSLYQ